MLQNVNQSHPLQQAQQILNSIYGYSDFRLHQADIIEALLQGNDVMTLMPTGGGKSLCYQIPSIIRKGTGIVVSPLIALMQDQVDALLQLGVRAAFLNSTLSRQQVADTERKLLAGELDLLYIAPERLLTENTLQLLTKIDIAVFAIDEAHCVSQWGHDFRKEYQQLRVLHQRFPHAPRIALTATADLRTRNEIIEQLNLNDAAVFINSFDRPNIHYAISDGLNPRNELWRFISDKHEHDAGIVYCLSRKKVESVAEWLTQKGRTALPYHAGLPDEVRKLHQERFLKEEGIIIVATIAFGMGIDKPDVRFVAHLNLPKSIEAYYQETGRAGRDGHAANAWMSYGINDVITLRQFMHDSDADEQHKRIAHHKLEAMLGLCEITACRRQALLEYFGEHRQQPCGNCDNCVNPPQIWDGREAAQKALSCVYRCGQRFGVTYIVDVLMGKEDERIISNQHQQLSTFGIGKDLDNNQWRSVFRQLIALGYLDADPHGHGALKLTDKCRPLLRGETPLPLRKLLPREKSQEKTSTKNKSLRPMDEPLYEALRNLRRKLADEQGVPAYIIFHDATLEDMARIRPESLERLRYISGVGDQKLKRYGELFLAEIQSHSLPKLLENTLSDTINETLLLFSQNQNAETIAKSRQLKLSTIYSHFAAAIEAGLLNCRDVLNLTDEQYNEIVRSIEMLFDPEEQKLKPIHDALNEKYDYGILKCVLAETHALVH